MLMLNERASKAGGRMLKINGKIRCSLHALESKLSAQNIFFLKEINLFFNTYNVSDAL